MKYFLSIIQSPILTFILLISLVITSIIYIDVSKKIKCLFCIFGLILVKFTEWVLFDLKVLSAGPSTLIINFMISIVGIGLIIYGSRITF